MRIALGVIFAASLAILVCACPAPAQDGGLERTVLDSGMTVITLPRGGDLAAACLFIGVGSADEDKDNNGVTGLLNRVILACHPVGNASPPSLKIEQLGGRVDVETSSDYTCFTLTAPVRSFGAAMKVLADAVARPDCSEAALSSEKEAMLIRKDWMDDRLADRAYGLFIQKTYAGTKYSLDPEGDRGAIKKLQVKDIAAWHKTYYQLGNMTLSVCGRLSAASAVKMAGDAFKGFVSGQVGFQKKRAAGQGAPLTEKKTYESPVPEGRAAAVLGYTAPPAGSPDYPAMRLVEAALADGMGSRIFKALRDERGLAYSFGSLLPQKKSTSRLAFYAVLDEDRVYPAVEGIRKSAEAIVAGDFSDEELERARGRLLGDIGLEHETVMDSAWHAGLYDFMGLGADYPDKMAKKVEKLGKADMVKAAEKYIGNYTLVVLKPIKGRR